MPAEQLHLVRHGEVFNPRGVLYGRLDGFGLSELGRRMAAEAAATLAEAGRPVSAIVASPLQRTRESAAPHETAFGLEARIDERLIEPWNDFEGGRMSLKGDLGDIRNWAKLRNPFLPSWGEPYVQIAARMLQAMDEAWNSVEGGDVILVSHQLPIWMVHRRVVGESLPHDPRKRRCALSSITTFERPAGGAWVEADYRDPAAHLAAEAVDNGAV
ncbi:histidine phosphatase family protein [Agromyces seonyuensis]|uniref:Histidine phosphatase family protein n=1 Tax=Agromyces seonyuensis TaxID=2662446 RepID=A0A6I4NUK3_9MICO|nr:histidine phosphatase family protein [Agromyces seonyuensis]